MLASICYMLNHHWKLQRQCMRSTSQVAAPSTASMRCATLLVCHGSLTARLFLAGRTEAVQVLLLQRGSPLAGRRAAEPPRWRACPCRLQLAPHGKAKQDASRS